MPAPARNTSVQVLIVLYKALAGTSAKIECPEGISDSLAVELFRAELDPERILETYVEPKLRRIHQVAFQELLKHSHESQIAFFADMPYREGFREKETPLAFFEGQPTLEKLYNIYHLFITTHKTSNYFILPNMGTPDYRGFADGFNKLKLEFNEYISTSQHFLDFWFYVHEFVAIPRASILAAAGSVTFDDEYLAKYERILTHFFQFLEDPAFDTIVTN
jgi:hypothetical protein